MKMQDMKKSLRMFKNPHLSFFIFAIHRIQVQLDGNEYDVNNHGIKIPVDVYKSTTIRELRAAV